VVAGLIHDWEPGARFLGPDVRRTEWPLRRPGCRPTEYWSIHPFLDPIEEEVVTGVGAVTELPEGWAGGDDAAAQ
jgi:hypothetical protein